MHRPRSVSDENSPRMDWLKKLEPVRREDAGLEWWLWRKLPLLAVLAVALPLGILGLLHLFHLGDTREATLRLLQMAKFVCWGVLFFHASLLVTVAIGCIVVMIMKGPGYTADSYSVSHSDRPRTRKETDSEAQQRRQQR